MPSRFDFGYMLKKVVNNKEKQQKEAILIYF